MSNKTYIGNAKDRTNKFNDNEIVIGLNKDNLDFLTSKLSDKGWVNLTLKRTKDGKPYLEHWEPASQQAAPAAHDNQEELPF